jgi:flavin-binding protein dodecin
MTVYKMEEVVGTSATSVSDAIQGAVERATASFSDVQWFEVKEIRGRILPDQTPEYQVKVEIGFLLHAPEGGDVNGRRQGATKGSRQARSVAAQVAAKRGEKGRSDLAKGFHKQGRAGDR